VKDSGTNVLLKRNLLILTLFAPALVWAEGEAVDISNLLQPRFQFQHQTINIGNGHTSIADENVTDAAASHWSDRRPTVSGHLEQFDATIAYPFSRNKVVNFDLGVNIRFIDADLKTQAIEQQTKRINATLPMFHASALFNLPYDGLSASLGGSHIEYEQYRAFDYKAKLSYSWQNGFGLEGGWQHQQLNIDGSDFQTEYELKGPFLDLKYRF